jgi:hypothetical protein
MGLEPFMRPTVPKSFGNKKFQVKSNILVERVGLRESQGHGPIQY